MITLIYQIIIVLHELDESPNVTYDTCGCYIHVHITVTDTWMQTINIWYPVDTLMIKAGPDPLTLPTK